MQARDDLRAIERGLEQAHRGGVELVDRSPLVAQVAQALEDPPIEVEPAGRPGRDDEPGRVHLERDAGLAVGVE